MYKALLIHLGDNSERAGPLSSSTVLNLFQILFLTFAWAEGLAASRKVREVKRCAVVSLPGAMTSEAACYISALVRPPLSLCIDH